MENVDAAKVGWDQRATRAPAHLGSGSIGGPARLISRWSHPTMQEPLKTLAKIFHGFGNGVQGRTHGNFECDQAILATSLKENSHTDKIQPSRLPGHSGFFVRVLGAMRFGARSGGL